MQGKNDSNIISNTNNKINDIKMNENENENENDNTNSDNTAMSINSQIKSISDANTNNKANVEMQYISDKDENHNTNTNNKSNIIDMKISDNKHKLWNHKHGAISDRMINGKKCVWIGATAYPNLFTEEELKTIENTLDKLQERSQKNEHKKYTSQSTRSRKGTVARTKHFFAARYLWHITEYKKEGKDSNIGAGLRVDVDDVPDELLKLCEQTLVKYGVIKSNFIQGIAFNMYIDGSEGIGPHFDDISRFERPIITIRLFSDARIAFGTDLYGCSNGTFSIPLPRGCVLKLEKNGFAVDGIKHTVRACDMYEKSAVVILRRFQQNKLKEAQILHEKRMKNGYYDIKSKYENGTIIYGANDTKKNRYVQSDGFCVDDDEPIEFYDLTDDRYDYLNANCELQDNEIMSCGDSD
eukprot:101644_1